jgi:sulfur dioxygenase
MTHPIVKTIDDAGCFSYLVGCRETGEAMLVDPKVGKEASYAELCERYGLRLVLQVDTHTHADHLSASSRFLADGVPLAMAAGTGVRREHRALAEGDEVRVGALSFRVLEVPGHTPDSIALCGEGCVFTGDSLLVGGLGRSDFHGSDPAQLFESVRAKLMTLPDDTLVFPGHGYDGVLFSTIGTERERNEALRHADGAAYAAALGNVEGAGNTPEVDAALAMNLEPDPELPEAPPNVTACSVGAPARDPRDLVPETTAEEHRDDHAALGAAGRWIDVREPWEFAEGHVPGARSVPLSELGFRLDELRGEGPLVVGCRSGGRSLSAAKTLRRLGVAETVNLSGGQLRWEELGLPVEAGA